MMDLIQLAEIRNGQLLVKEMLENEKKNTVVSIVDFLGLEVIETIDTTDLVKNFVELDYLKDLNTIHNLLVQIELLNTMEIGTLYHKIKTEDGIALLFDILSEISIIEIHVYNDSFSIKKL